MCVYYLIKDNFYVKIILMLRYLFLIFLITISILTFSKISYAQFDELDNSIVVNIDPEYPEKNNNVFISLESYATDLNEAYIEWIIDSKTVLKGTGKTKLNFILKKDSTSISIKINTGDGRFVQKDFNIKPTSLDLIWEADTYTPPFFKGKPLYTRESLVYIYATPHIYNGTEEIPREKMIYRWSNNGDAIQNVSGYGKYFIQIKSSILGRDMEIEVEAEDPKTNQIAHGSVVLSPSDPVVYIYQKDPLLGIKTEKALNVMKVNDNLEKEIYSIPYFFSIQKPTDLEISWSINGLGVNDNQNVVNRIFKKVGDTFGVSRIDVNFINRSNIMQGAQSSITVDFQKPQEDKNNSSI